MEDNIAKPKNNKERCEECQRLLKKCKLRTNPRTGRLLCKRCDKKEITNPFYIPPEKRRSKYTVDQTEAKNLYKQFMNQGMSPKEASKRIKRLKMRLNYTKNMFKRKRILMKVKEQENKELNKQLAQGLGMKRA